jgi:hypothetical protein
MSTQQESFAEDIYRINNAKSLVTASHEDLASFMALNARHMTLATASAIVLCSAPWPTFSPGLI